MEQFATLCEFENDIVILPRFREIDKLDDIRVIKLAHNLDFFQDVGALRLESASCSLEASLHRTRSVGNH